MDMKQIMILILILLIASSTIVYAAGSSTGGSSGSGTSSSSSSKPKITTTTIKAIPNCEDLSDLKGRIKCRLDQKTIVSTIPEACRTLRSPSSCIALYNTAEICYEKSGFDKDKCFKEKSGFIRKTISEQGQLANKEVIQNYIVLLLYDLQERIENDYNNGKITSEQASNLISLIVEIKQALLAGKSKSEIKPMITSLKSQWQSIM